MRSDKRESESEEESSLPLPANCDYLFRALTECHRRSGTDSFQQRVAVSAPEPRAGGVRCDGVVSRRGGGRAESLLISNKNLCWILHDWCDEDCIKILQRCKEAIPPRDAGGKVIIVGIVVGSVGSNHRESQLLFDVLMMTLFNGKERNEEEWWKLFEKAGFTSYKIAATLGIRSIIEVYP